MCPASPTYTFRFPPPPEDAEEASALLLLGLFWHICNVQLSVDSEELKNNVHVNVCVTLQWTGEDFSGCDSC